ncbi:nephrin-like [Oratosquilla oratoria]|uniref:nephrin-like n=1 Tax=Oratosquilla oratoria TaxID=337810 RepID=UPI003F75B0EA
MNFKSCGGGKVTSSGRCPCNHRVTLEQLLFLLLFLLLLLVHDDQATALQGDNGIVTVVAGRRASLPCHPIPGLPDNPPALVLWYLRSNTTPIYSYDARKGAFNRGVRWSDAGVLGERAYFSLLTEPPALVLDPVHPRDEGTYTCRLDYPSRPTSSSRVRLNVIIPPGKPIIIWRDQHISPKQKVGPLVEGDHLILTCRSLGGKPRPSLKWWRDGWMLEDDFEEIERGGVSGVESVLRINVTRDLHRAPLSCHAANTPMEQPNTTAVTLNVLLPPLSAQVLGKKEPVSAGHQVQFVCRSVGSNPPATVTWWRGDSQLLDVQESTQDGGNVTSSAVTFTPQSKDHGQYVTCRAENPRLPAALVEDTRRLNIQYKPEVKLSLGKHLDPDNLKEGDDVFLECTTMSNPPVQILRWYQNGQLLSHNKTRGIILSGQVLVLQGIRQQSSGTYKCNARNTEGSGTSNPVNLSVKYTPVCSGARTRTLGTTLASSIRVPCTVEAHPTNVTFEWSLNVTGQVTPIVGKAIRSRGLTSMVTYTPSSPESYGTLLCWARNVIGRQRTPCEITVVPAGPPNAPTNCSILNQTTRALRIECTKGFDGGLGQKFILEAWSEEDLIANTSSDSPVWEVSGLRGGNTVTVRVYAFNSRGNSPAVRLRTYTPAPQLHLREGFSDLHVVPMVGALVGGVGVLILLLMVSCAVGHITKKRRRRYIGGKEPGTYTLVQRKDKINPDVVNTAALGQRGTRLAGNQSHRGRHGISNGGSCIGKACYYSDEADELTDLTAEGRARAAVEAEAEAAALAKARQMRYSSAALPPQPSPPPQEAENLLTSNIAPCASSISSLSSTSSPTSSTTPSSECMAWLGPKKLQASRLCKHPQSPAEASDAVYSVAGPPAPSGTERRASPIYATPIPTQVSQPRLNGKCPGPRVLPPSPRGYRTLPAMPSRQSAFSDPNHPPPKPPRTNEHHVRSKSSLSLPNEPCQFRAPLAQDEVKNSYVSFIPARASRSGGHVPKHRESSL